MKVVHLIKYLMASAMDSKVVLITGGATGLGAAIAKAFAKQEACLALCSLDEVEFDDTVQECKNLGAKHVLKITTDLSKKENMETLMNETIKTFQRLDVLVNCAGIGEVGSIRDITLESYDRVMSINIRTPMYLTQLAVPHLEKTKGNILNMSSISSVICTPTIVLSYCISKAALDRLTRMSAFDLASSGIRVNALNPSYVETRLLKKTADILEMDIDTTREVMGKLHPLEGRIVKIQEVVDAVLFLTSDKASMITGVTLPIEGGRILTGQ